MADQAIELKFDSKKAEQFFADLNKRLGIVNDAEEKFVNILSAIVFQDIMSHFEKERGSKGPWKPWSKMYADHMAMIGKGGNKILQDTGRLRQSFTPGQWRSHPAGIEWYNPAKTSSGFPYAYAHNEGGPKLPKRDFMWLSKTALDKMAKATVAFLAGENGS